MKNIFHFLFIILFLACESDGSNNQYCDIVKTEIINLSNPQFINIQVPGGWAYANGSVKGLVIYNFGNSFKAFSRECPHVTCAGKLSVVNNIKLVCPCDDAEFSILDGSPQTAGISESVCEFRVIEVSSSILNITNF